MRIAFINNFYNFGGSTKTAYALAKEFSKEHQMQFYGFWDGEFREAFSKLGEAFILNSIGFDYEKDLDESILRFDPDIVHIFIPGSQNPSYFSRLPPRTKKFLTVLCNQKIGFDHLIFDKIFFQSEYGQSYTGLKYNGVVVRPGYDYYFAHREQKKTPTLSRVSAFCPSKLISHTVYAASIFKNNNWVVAGEIQDPKEYESIVRTKQEASIQNLAVVSNLTDEKVKAIIETTDIWHYPTSSEVFCFSALEAMAAAKPIISYKLDAVKEFFDTDDWLADGVADMIAKTEKMINLSPSERQKIGLANYQNYLKYSGKNFAARIMREYESVLNPNKSVTL